MPLPELMPKKLASEIEQLAEVLSLMARHFSPVQLCQALSQSSLFATAGAPVIGVEFFRLDEKGKFASIGHFGIRANPFQWEDAILGINLEVDLFKTLALSFKDLERQNQRLVIVPLVSSFPLGILVLLYKSQEFLPRLGLQQMQALGSATEMYLGRMSLAQVSKSKSSKLSDRQLQVLGLLAKGLTNQKIADELTTSHSTIRQTTIAIYAKLGVSSRGAAVAAAKSRGLI